MEVNKIRQNINSKDLENYLNYLLGLDPRADSSPLTEEQQQELLNVLVRLNDAKLNQLTSIWSLLSLYFSREQKKRSGIIIMSLYHRLNFSESNFTKKSFPKELKKLVSKHPTFESVEYTLSIIDISKQYFYENLFKWKNEEERKNLMEEDAQWDWHNNFPIKILEENEFDSDPDTLLYQNLLDAFEEQQYQQIYRNFSYIPQRKEILDLSDSDSENIFDIDETISIRRKPYIDGQERLENVQRKKQRRGRRPKRKQRKSKLIAYEKTMRRKQTNYKNFLNKKREKIRKNREETTQKKSMKERKIKPMVTSVKSRKITSANRQFRLIDSSYEQEGSLIEIQDSDKQEEGFLQNRTHKYKRLSFMHENEEYEEPARNIDIQEFIYQESPILENFEDLQIRVIVFHLKELHRHASRTVYPQNYFSLLKPKELLKEVKQLAFLSNSQKAMEIQTYMRAYELYKYYKGQNKVTLAESHARPIMNNQLTKNICSLIKNLIQFLLMSKHYQDMSNLNDAANFFYQALELIKQSEQKKIFIEGVYSAFAQIIENLNGAQKSTTKSMIQFHSIQTYLMMDLPMNRKDFVLSVYLSVVVLDVCLFQKLFVDFFIKKENEHLRKYSGAMEKCFKIENQKKAFLVKKILQTYQLNAHVITQNTRETMLKFISFFNLQKDQPEQLFNVLERLDHHLIMNKKNEEKNANYKHLFNKIFVNFQNINKSISKQNKAKILLTKCSIIVSDDLFYDKEMTYKLVLKQLEEIDFKRDFQIANLKKLSSILLSLYEMKLNQHNQINDLFFQKKTPEKLLKDIQDRIFSFFQSCLQKYQILLSKNQLIPEAQQKKIQLESLIKELISSLIEKSNYYQCITHYFFALSLSLGCLLNIINSNKLEDNFKHEIQSIIMRQIHHIEGLEKHFEKEKELALEQDDDEELFEIKQKRGGIRENLRKRLMQDIQKSLKIGDMTKKIMNPRQMREQKDYVLNYTIQNEFKFQGFIFGLENIKIRKNQNKKANTQQIIQPEEAELIKIASRIHSNIELTQEFLIGYIETLLVFQDDETLKFNLNPIKDTICNIIMIGLCIGEQQSRKSWQLYKLLAQVEKKSKIYEKSPHFLSKILNKKSKCSNIETNGSLKLLLEDLNKFSTNDITVNVRKSFKSYFDICKRFYSLYKSGQLTLKISYLSSNLLQMLNFLMKSKEYDGLINIFKPYFTLNNTSLVKGNFQLLKQINLQLNAHTIIEFLLLGGNSFKETLQNYFKFIVLSQLKNSQNNQDYNLPQKIGLLLKKSGEICLSEKKLRHLLIQSLFQELRPDLTSSQKHMIINFLIQAFDFYRDLSPFLISECRLHSKQIEGFLKMAKNSYFYRLPASIEEMLIKVMSASASFSKSLENLEEIYILSDEKARRIMNNSCVLDEEFYRLIEKLSHFINKAVTDYKSKNEKQQRLQKAIQLKNQVLELHEKIQIYKKQLILSDLKTK